MKRVSVLKLSKLVSSALLAVAITTQSALACTGIVLKSADGTTVPARTMEFGFDIQSNIFAVPLP